MRLNPPTWLILAFSVSLLAAGCATGNQSTTTQTTQSTDQADDKPPTVPTPEELEGSPCGNPNWAKLPDEHQENGNPKDSDSPTSGDEKSDEKETGDNENSGEKNGNQNDRTSAGQTNRPYACRPADSE